MGSNRWSIEWGYQLYVMSHYYPYTKCRPLSELTLFLSITPCDNANGLQGNSRTPQSSSPYYSSGVRYYLRTYMPVCQGFSIKLATYKMDKLGYERATDPQGYLPRYLPTQYPGS